MASVLVVMGVPRLVSALYQLDAAPVVQAVRAGRPVEDAVLTSAIQSLERAAGWQGDSKAEAERGILLAARASNAPGDYAKHAALAEQAFANSLATTPAQPETWFRLAWLRDAGGNRPGAVEALRMSLLAGGFAPHLMVQRIQLGLRLLPAMADAEREMLKRQIRLTWISTPDALLPLSSATGSAAFVKEALDDLTEEDMARYIRARESK